MTTMLKSAARVVVALALATTVAACGDNSGHGSPDMAMQQGGGDMSTESCAMNPMTPVELLNACTTAQTGDPAKDAPYFPTLAPNGQLPPLP